MFENISQKFYNLFSRFSKTRTVSERSIAQTLTSVQEALLAADVPYVVTQAFIAEVQQEVIDKKISAAIDAGDFFIKIVHDRLLSYLSVASENRSLVAQDARVMVMGLQGAGKTTSCAKLAYRFAKNALDPVLVSSVDFTRPAAHEQLKILAQRAGVVSFEPVHTGILAATQHVMQHVARHNVQALILDTAGRMHIEQSLLDELAQVAALVRPTYRLLVLDAMMGQQVLAVAQAFDAAVGVDGVFLTKMDSDTAAGAALACTYMLKKPIVLIGTGEHVEDSEDFYPDRVAKRMLGMGDIQSLLDRVSERIASSDQQSLQEKFLSGSFSLDDFAQQMDMMKRLGSLAHIMRFLPGGMAVSREQMRQGEQLMCRYRVIIDSMTRDERLCPVLLDKSRVARVARGAGVTQAEVRELLAKFEQSKQFVKLIRKTGLLRK